jgi:hypothetical protein
MKIFHLETPQHEALECETLLRNMHGKNQDEVCHVTKNKHEDECMQILKQKENFYSTKRPRCPVLLFVGIKTFHPSC